MNNLKLENQKYYFIVNWNEAGVFNCSKSFEEIIGYTANEISQMPFKHHSLMSNEHVAKIHQTVLNSYSDTQNEQKPFDIELVSKDGRSYWFREFISLTDTNEFICTLFDISDFKTVEVELNKTIEEKTALNDSKNKLISIISHDLRAPFSSLLGFSEILLNETNLPEEERIEYLQYIYDASTIQLQMVNHLLDWTRLQTGAIKFEPHRLDIRDIVDNCVSVLTGSVIRKDIEIKVKGNHGIFVTADERLISQVVTNLLSNAVKFTPSGKTITVTIDLFKDNMVEIVVADEGVGIEEEFHDKLFKIESKFTKTGTAGEKGSGFGLALVKEIVEKHSGNIWFYSEINKGSEFHFTLPKSDDTILILEEHEDLQNVYKEIFGDSFQNYNLHFCANGFEALNFFMQKMPAILITYHSMPLMNGVQLVSALREKDIHNKVTIIVLGNKITDEEKDEYKKLNVNQFMDINSSPDEIKILLKDMF